MHCSSYKTCVKLLSVQTEASHVKTDLLGLMPANANPLLGFLALRVAISESIPLNMCASEDSDQPAHSRSLIRIFTGRILDSQGCKVSSCGQRRPWSDCADAQADLSLRWAHVRRFVFSPLQLISADIEGPDHPHRLIWVFAVRIYPKGTVSYGPRQTKKCLRVCAKNGRIHIILHMRKFSSVHLLSNEAF